jgi:hypothetical protein
MPSASSPVLMFYVPGIIFDGTEGVGSRFNVLRSRLIFGGTVGVGSRFHVLRARTRFPRCRVRQVPFSCFPRPGSFSTVPRALGPVFIFCTHGLFFGHAECVGSRFHVLRAQTHFRRYRGCQVPFSSFVLPSRFHVLRSRTRFSRYRGRRLPFSFFARPDSFLTVPMGSGPVFMFCALRRVFAGTEGVGSLFHVFALGLVFGCSECVGSPFHVMRAQIHSRRNRWRRVTFSIFALPDSFSAVPRASGPFFMFSLSDSFLAVPRSSGPIFMFCAL